MYSWDSVHSLNDVVAHLAFHRQVVIIITIVHPIPLGLLASAQPLDIPCPVPVACAVRIIIGRLRLLFYCPVLSSWMDQLPSGQRMSNWFLISTVRSASSHPVSQSCVSILVRCAFPHTAAVHFVATGPCETHQRRRQRDAGGCGEWIQPPANKNHLGSSISRISSCTQSNAGLCHCRISSPPSLGLRQFQFQIKIVQSQVSM